MHLSHFQASKFQRIWLTYPQAFSVEAVQGVPLDILLPNFELDFTFYNSFSANYWKVSPFVTAKKKGLDSSKVWVNFTKPCTSCDTLKMVKKLTVVSNFILKNKALYFILSWIKKQSWNTLANHLIINKK